uniref:Lipid body protein n=1 Tax=Lobosphaera incisa TaxID=312850 RepID=A0A1X9QDU3_9CHLO|nr:lipid body protein [Lobosphaera incisa]
MATRQPGQDGRSKLASWSVDDVCQMLSDLELASISAKFKENAVNGPDLEDLSEQDLQTCLGLTPLQARKVRRKVAELSGNVPSNPQAQGTTTALQPATPAKQASVPFQANAHNSTTPPPAKQSQFKKSDLEEYRNLSQRIDQLQRERVEEATAPQELRLRQLQQILGATQQQLATCQTEAAGEAEKHKDIDDGAWYPGKLIRGKGHHKEKQERLSRAAAEADAKVQKVTAQLQRVQADIAAQSVTVQDLHAKVQELKQLQAAQAALIERLFAGATPASDAVEDQLEAQVKQLAQRQQEAERALAPYVVGGKEVNAAARQLDQAQQELARAFGMSGIDLANDFIRPGIGPGGLGGLAADIAKRRSMDNAQQLVATAVHHIRQARMALPMLPGITEACVDQLDRVFGDIVFDNIFSDMRARRDIMNAQSAVESMARDVHYTVRWAQEAIAKLQADVDAHRINRTGVTAQLHSRRLGLLELACKQVAAAHT